MKPENIPNDIYSMLCDKTCSRTPEEIEDILDVMAEDMKQLVRDALGPEQERVGRLRLSAIGKPDRQIYNSYVGADSEELSGNTRVKFLYGHLIEAMLIGLVRLSGHDVTDQQKACEVNGIKGSMDCTIDGVTVDVKSCSSYGFKKFKEGKLHEDDPFGYIAQLKAYAHSEQNNQIGWLAMDKQNGHLCWLGYDLDNLHPRVAKELGYDIVDRVEAVKKLVGDGASPKHCYQPIPDGKSGNMKLPMGCSYCDFKKNCYPGLRTFLYGSGPRYLTEVVREPRAVELREDF